MELDDYPINDLMMVTNYNSFTVYPKNQLGQDARIFFTVYANGYGGQFASWDGIFEANPYINPAQIEEEEFEQEVTESNKEWVEGEEEVEESEEIVEEPEEEEVIEEVRVAEEPKEFPIWLIILIAVFLIVAIILLFYCYFTIKEAEMDEKVIVARCSGPCVVKQAEFFEAWPK